MNDILSTVDKWVKEKELIAIATVVKTWGSSPRAVGSKMVINSQGEMAGSVSGGCVEGAVVESAKSVLTTGKSVLLKFGVSDEGAWDVGLACGGEIEVFVQPMDIARFSTKINFWIKGIEFINILVIDGPDNLLGKEVVIGGPESGFGKSSDPSGYSTLESLVFKAVDNGVPTRKKIRSDILFANESTSGTPLLDDLEVFIEPVGPTISLVIVGGVHIAIPLVTFAKTLGFYVIIIDPRRKFGNSKRFPLADQIINSWPKVAFSTINVTSSTAVAVLTHDPKIDDAALEIALNTPAFYVGALGSKNTQLQRRDRLIKSGITYSQIKRLHGPIGIEINSRSPEEIALSIISEVVLEKNK